MSDTQTLEGIKQAAPGGATHYHVGLQVYLRMVYGEWEINMGQGWHHTETSSKQIGAGVECGEIVVLADIPCNDMAESMPFELLDGDEEKPRSKYHREIAPGVFVDVYDVLKAFDVRCPALQHMIKKCLAPGQRGHKSLAQDLDEIVASAERARELGNGHESE